MSKFLQGWILGLTAGTILVTCIWGSLVVKPMAELEQTRKQMIEGCQKELPRSQKCELVAIPSVGDKK